jgi:hypothetical protein
MTVRRQMQNRRPKAANALFRYCARGQVPYGSTALAEVPRYYQVGFSTKWSQALCFYSRDEFSDIRLLTLLRAAAYEANVLIEQTDATVADPERLVFAEQLRS